MKKQVATESNEWNGLYWAVMAIAAWVILSSLFGCTPEPSACTEDYVAKYWFLGGVPVVLFYWLYKRSKANFPQIIFGSLFLICFVIYLLPYCLMFALWVMTELIP